MMAAWDAQQHPVKKNYRRWQNCGSLVRAAASRAEKSTAPGKIMAAWDAQQYPVKKEMSYRRWKNYGGM